MNLLTGEVRIWLGGPEFYYTMHFASAELAREFCRDFNTNRPLDK